MKKLWDLLNEYQETLENKKLNQFQQGYTVGVQQGILKAIQITMGEGKCSCKEVVEVPVIIEPEKVVENIMANTEKNREIKSNKKLVVFCCDECNDRIVMFTDPEQPIYCNKCENWNHLGDLLPGSYYCECGAKFKFVQDDKVDKIKCRDCGHIHPMLFDPSMGEWKSIDDIRYKEEEKCQ